MAVPQTSKAVIVVALAVAGGVVFYWWWSRGSQPPPPPPRVEVAPPPVAVPDARVEPQIQHPIEKAGRRPSTPSPSLDDSDREMREKLGALFGVKRLTDLFILDGIIRRIVATVDNLPREQVSPSLWAVTPTPGELLVESRGAGLTLSARNRSRYEARLVLAESVEPRKLVALYVRHYPLFQQAYQELGYPQGYFNDRLIEVIDHLLAAPDAPEPVALLRVRTRYEFADPELQRRSAGQKFLLRVGPQNAARIKALLRGIRREVTGQTVR
jgi:hypothetical protein